MIEVTRLDGAKMVVNADLIELIEATPDTIISLTTNRKLIVKDSVAEIVAKVIAFKRSIRQQRRAKPSEQGVDGRP